MSAREALPPGYGERAPEVLPPMRWDGRGGDPRDGRGGGGGPPGWDDRGDPRDMRGGPPPGDRRGSFGYNNGGAPGPVYGGGGGGRRRSRSPPMMNDWDDRRNKRRRSLSPPFRGGPGGGGGGPPDRGYPPPPRDFYNNNGPPPPRGGYRSPPYRDNGGPSYPNNSLARPLPPSSLPARSLPPSSLPPNPQQSLDTPYLLNQRQFLSHSSSVTGVSGAASDEEKEKAWKKYRVGYLKKAYKGFWEEVGEKTWCKEKYDQGVEEVERRKERKVRGVGERVEEWCKLLESGGLDEVTFDQPKASTSTTETESLSTTLDEDPIVEEPTSTTTTSTTEDIEMKPASTDPPASSAPTTTPTPLGEGLVQLSTSDKQLFIKSISPDISRKELEAHCSQSPGFVYLSLSDPNPNKHFHRVGWVTFDTRENMEAAKDTLCESTVSNFVLHMNPNVLPITARTKTTPQGMNAPERVAVDLENVKKLVARFEKDFGPVVVEGEEARVGSKVIEEKFSAAEEGDEKNKKLLDCYLHYLRFTFHTCYYCLAVCDYPEELERKCAKHLRKEGPAKVGDTNPWIVKFDEKLPLVLEKDSVDPADFGGESVEEEQHRICSPHIKQEEEGKFRCKECNKLFSALKFIEKHIGVKHSAIIGDKLEKLKPFNSFVLDPLHPPFGALEPVIQPPPPPTMAQVPPPPQNGFNRNPLQERIGGRMDDDRERGYGPRGGGGRGGGNSGGGMRRELGPRGPPPPPPPGAIIDPRARKERSSYADLDGAPAGVADVVLQY